MKYQPHLCDGTCHAPKEALPAHDTAVPIDWLMEGLNTVKRVAPAFAKHSVLSHLVWSYGEDTGICGEPLPLCPFGAAWLALAYPQLCEHKAADAELKWKRQQRAKAT